MKSALLVADAGPLIALAIAEALLAALDEFELLIPEPVWAECLADPGAPGASAIDAACRRTGARLIPAVDITPLDPAYAQGLGSGEVAVLSYAAQHGYVALVDERRARRVAARIGVPVTGSGALLLALKERGRVESVRSALAAWQSHGYFVAKTVEAELLRRAGEG